MRMLLLFIACILFHQPAAAQEDADYRRMASRAFGTLQAKNYLQSGQLYEHLFIQYGTGSHYIDRYNAACAWALAGQPDRAFSQLFYLAKATAPDPGKLNDAGFTNNRVMYLHDDDFKPLYHDKRWEEFQAMLRAKNRPLVNTLDSIYLDDQDYRYELTATEKKYGRESVEINKLWLAIEKHDAANLIKIEKIIAQYGWPSADSVGRRGNMAVFLVIQHADIKTRKKYLPLMRQAVKDKKARPQDLALLEDRTALESGKRQIYGSQVGRDSAGNYYVRPLEDPDNVDKRRSSMGLGPLAYYLKNWNIGWNIADYKNQLPQIELLEKNSAPKK